MAGAVVDNLLSSVPGLAAGGLTAGAGFALMLKLLDWLGGRVDARSAVIERREQHADQAMETAFQTLQNQFSSALKRIDDLETEVQKVRAELVECMKKHAEAEARAAKAEAREQAMGDGRQHAALIVAQEKAAAKIATKFIDKERSND